MSIISNDDKNKMELIPYVRNCFKTFEELPFNTIDATVLAVMSYIYINESCADSFSDKGMSMSELMRAEYFDGMCSALPSKEDQVQLIFAVCASPRYRNITIKYYRNELKSDISLQFSGVVYSINEKMHVIAFRGTDKTFVGWKEDVLLLMKKNAPAQMMAVNYLNGVGKKLEGELIVTGHSKGGNLASHAAAHCEKVVQDKITHIYNLDGPGFLKAEVADSDMLAVKDRITKITPVGSPIGIILQNEVEPLVIKSNKHAIMQHDPFGWVIDGNEFEQVKGERNYFKVFIDNIDEWAEVASDDEIKEFAEIFFGIFEDSNYKTYDELGISYPSTVKKIVKNMKGMDSKKRKKMFSILKNAMSGDSKKKDKVNTSTDEIDWTQIDCLLNDMETRQFAEIHDLSL